MPILPILFVVGFFVLRLLFPGDASYLGDESFLTTSAWYANQAGELATHSLAGAGGIVYGPFAIWIYQFFFLFTKDLVVVTFFKNLLTIIAAIYSVWVALQYLKVNRWLYVLVLLLSPYMCFYGRNLWDNSLLIAFSGLVFSCYLHYCKSKKLLPLSLCIILLACSSLIHLMITPMALAIATHYLMYHQKELKKDGYKLIPAFVLSFFIMWPYLHHLATAKEIGLERHTFWQGIKHLQGFANPLLCPRYFSYVGFDYLASPGWWIPASVLDWKVLLVPFYLITFFCFIPAYWGFFAFIGDWKKKTSTLLAPLCVLTFLFHWAISTWKALGDFPHYFNALWLIILICFARGMLAASKKKWMQKAFKAYLVSCGICLVVYMFQLHINGGTRYNQNGPSLANKLSVAKRMIEYDPSSEIIGRPGLWPMSTIGTVRDLRNLLVSMDKPTPTKGKKVLEIYFAHPEDPRNGRIEFRALDE